MSAFSRASARISGIDASYWKRNVKNAADQDQFFNTGIVFPLNFKGGDLNGWNLRFDGGPVESGVRGYLFARPRSCDL